MIQIDIIQSKNEYPKMNEHDIFYYIEKLSDKISRKLNELEKNTSKYCSRFRKRQYRHTSHKDYMKMMYDTRYSKWYKEKITCECGRLIRRGSINIHKTTTIHKQLMHIDPIVC